ncbi:MAG TPA: DUF4233 domain-containing protein, partial [Actinomycetes bacterium]|nr:DUF4233 domain-containing protein [Actinomycetes bacterium]
HGARCSAVGQTGEMRAIAASVLVFEAIIVVLAIPVAIDLGGVDAAAAGFGGAALALACLLTAGLLRYPWGYAVGWVLQGLLVLSGFVVTAMFILGALFTVLWAVGLRVGRRGEELRAERWAGVDDPKASGATPAG